MKLNETIKCADGFTMSVQAHGGAYCSPRTNNAEKYTAVEVGFPNREEPLLLDFAEDPDKPTDTVYGWVPAKVVVNVIAKHGGMVKGELPRGIAPLVARGRQYGSF